MKEKSLKEKNVFWCKTVCCTNYVRTAGDSCTACRVATKTLHLTFPKRMIKVYHDHGRELIPDVKENR